MSERRAKATTSVTLTLPGLQSIDFDMHASGGQGLSFGPSLQDESYQQVSHDNMQFGTL